MRKRDALKLHNGDEVIEKFSGSTLRVLDRSLSVSGRYVVIEAITPTGIRVEVFHDEVR